MKGKSFEQNEMRREFPLIENVVPRNTTRNAEKYFLEISNFFILQSVFIFSTKF